MTRFNQAVSVRQPLTHSIRDGVWVGMLAGTVLIAAWYLGWKAAGLSFLPFDLFDWVVRQLPGSLVTKAVDLIVEVHTRLHIDGVLSTGKLAEQTLAVALSLVVSVLAVSALFVALNYSGEPAAGPGVVLGILLAFSGILIDRTLKRSEMSSSIWIFMTSVAWGLAVGLGHARLRGIGRDDAVGARSGMTRRWFLIRMASAAAVLVAPMTAVATVIGRLRKPGGRGSRWSDDHGLPNAADPTRPVPGTRSEFTPLEDHYRVDVDTRPPAIDGAQWRLRLAGFVSAPVELSLDALRAEPSLDQFITLSCVSNPVGGDLIGTTRWTGVSLQRIAQMMRLDARASHLRFVSADGFVEVVALEIVQRDPRAMLAYAWDGAPLTEEHGFPLRLFVPDVYGMKQPKWIVRVDAIDRWEPGYWVQRGWSREGRVVATSVVDTVRGVGGTTDGRRSIEAGGIAYAGARGILKVETRVDDGEWSQAQLRAPLSDTTWVVWRAEMTAQPGKRVVAVRCFERDGMPQTAAFHSHTIDL